MNTISSNYEWLSNVGALPKTIQQGLRLLGVAEVVGKGSNRTIIGWRDELNAAGVKIAGFSDDDIPWCGLFAAIVAHRAGKNVVAEPLWARNWERWGVATEAAGLGDCLVFVRNGGGHVGWYVAEDATAYHVLGGNQANRVSIARIAKERCIAVRRPVYITQPGNVRAYVVRATGGLSKVES